MGVDRKTCCLCAGSSLSLCFAALTIAGFGEKNKFEPFYRDTECPEVPLAIPMMRFSLPPQMLPPGTPPMSPPYGLFGSILNTTSSCRNPNQVKITTRKSDFESTLYVPDMSNWTWGVSEKQVNSGKIGNSYIKVASSHLKYDFVLPANGTGTSVMETTANTTIAPFLGLFQTVLLSGYAPLYTKTVATSDSCIKLFGLEFCGTEDTITWCGVLAGNCQTKVQVGGMKAWSPGLCSYTKTICRLGGDRGEAEMKTLVTAENLGVGTMNLPCAAQTGLPPSMNCPIAQAPGINATLHQVQISEFVDGPFPDQKDIDDAESMITLVTNLVIALGTLGIFFSGCLAAFCVWRCRVAAPASNPTTTYRLPSILNTQSASKKQQGGSAQGTSDLARV